MTNLLLVYGALQMGGIETFIVRMAKSMRARGVSVTVLLLSRRGDPELTRELGKYARVVYLQELLVFPWLFHERLSIFNWFLPKSKARVAALMDPAQHVHFFDSFTMMATLDLLKALDVRKKVTGGVYHQYEFAFNRLRGTYFLTCFKRMFRHACPAQNLIFFNEISKKTLECDSGAPFSDSPLLPIGVDLSKVQVRQPGAENQLKVVSIGRITRFKTYNFHFLDTIKNLAERGIFLEYHIYGDGEDVPALADAIAERALGKQVFLHGTLPYSQFARVIDDAFLFLGSGTALIEAAACGVPALIGVESNSESTSYGFLHQMEGLSYHEKGLDHSMYSFEYFIKWLSGLSPAEYAKVCFESAEKAREFSIDIFAEKFLVVDERATEVDTSSIKWNRLLFSLSLMLDRVANKRRKGRGFWQRYVE